MVNTARADNDNDNIPVKSETDKALAYLYELLDDGAADSEACRAAVTYCIERGWLSKIAFTVTFLGFQEYAEKRQRVGNSDIIRAIREGNGARRDANDDDDVREGDESDPRMDIRIPLPLQVAPRFIDLPSGEREPLTIPLPVPMGYSALTCKVNGQNKPIAAMDRHDLATAAPYYLSNAMGNVRKYALVKVVMEQIGERDGAACDVLGADALAEIGGDAQDAATRQALGINLINDLGDGIWSVSGFAHALRLVERYD